MRAIITGATGAIGSALIKELVKNGNEVLVFNRPSSSRTSNIINSPLVTIRECDLCNLKNIQPKDEESSYDVFYHFAWMGTTGSSRNDMYLQNQNVEYALDAVGCAHRFGCKLFVGAGSQAEYGIANEKLNSSTPTHPFMGYGYAKLAAGMMTRDYAHQLGLAHTWVRILSVYGLNDSSVSLISSLIQKLSAGTEPNCSAGEQIWDYLYSEDAAKAFSLIGRKTEGAPIGTAAPQSQASKQSMNGLSDVDGKTFVLGSGSEAPLRSYIETLQKVMVDAGKANPDTKINYGAIPYGPNQVMYLCADISELTKATGWEPATSFEDGIRSIV